MRISIINAVVTAALSFCGAILFARSPGDLPHAILAGERIELVPAKMSFVIPHNWLALYQNENFNNLQLTRSQLERSRQPTAPGWDAQYAKIVNAVLPFENCAVHAGGDGWAENSRVHTDVQMRVYVGQWSVDNVTLWVRKRGLPIARAVATDAWQSKVSRSGTSKVRQGDLVTPLESSEKESLIEESMGEWHRSRLSFPLWNIDYGGIGIVDFYTRGFGQETVVLVFMHVLGANQEVFIAPIVASFKP
jgi:hypothetical protein